jgi:prevent-host-death family protein
MRVKVRSLRAELGKILREVGNEPVTVTRHGEDVAVLISPGEYARLRSVYTKLHHQRDVRLAS